VAGAVGAAAIFSVFGRFTRRPIRIIWGVATVGLLLSFLPIALAGARAAAGDESGVDASGRYHS
jgi:hypothetical protein